MADHLRAVRKNWWLVLVVTCVAIGLALLMTARAVPQYSSSVTFFVSASSDTGTALQADEFAQRRINSYVGVLTSEKLAREIIDEHDVDLDVAEVIERIGAVADPDTVLLTATVTDTDPERSLAIATAIAEEFPRTVSDLDNQRSASNAADVLLNVISGPTLQPEAVSPRPRLNLAIGVLLGLTAGIALSIGREMADTSIRSTDMLGKVTGVPVLASVSVDGSRRSGRVTNADPRSARAEAYRQLRTNLTFSNVGHRMQVIVVTSALSGDGKSTTAANLAIVLAETGRPVLLLDADLRRPSIAEYLDIEGGAGLTNVLAEQLTAEEATQRWGPGGLHVMTTGTLPPNPSELIGSDAMRSLMAELRERFEVVVIDTPPLLPVTDAAVASAHADGVVLVTSYGRTTRDQVGKAVQNLRAVDAHISGAVLNMAPGRDANGGGYDSYTVAAGVGETPPPTPTLRGRRGRSRRGDTGEPR